MTVETDERIEELEYQITRLESVAAAQRRAWTDELVDAIHSYQGWLPGGLFVPTEPDRDERARTRVRLAVKIDTLMLVLGMSREEREPWQKRAEER